MQRQKSFEKDVPSLYLVATPIGNLEEMTPRAIEILKSVDVIAAEDTRNTIRLLNHFQISNKLISHHDHNEYESSQGIIELIEDGKSVALVSDAGYPAISDPGYVLVKKCIEEGINVIPISGANASLNALVASGLAPQPFVFYGFLAQNDKEKKRQLNDLKYHKETLIFYEAPHRITKTLNCMLEVLGDRRICLARELTKRYEEFIRGTISEVVTISDDLKGEMVIVVEGSNDSRDQFVYEYSVEEQINIYMSQGMSSSQAIKTVAKERGLSKNEIYRKFHN